MRKAFALVLAIALSGCAYNLTLHPRDGGPVGSGTANSSNKSLTIDLAGKTYRGTYVYDGGSPVFSQTFGNATAFNRFGTTSAYGSATTTGYVPGSGQGRVVAFASDGSSIRCEFTFRQGSGIGVCEDNTNKPYDLVISGQ